MAEFPNMYKIYLTLWIFLVLGHIFSLKVQSFFKVVISSKNSGIIDTFNYVKQKLLGKEKRGLKIFF